WPFAAASHALFAFLRLLPTYISSKSRRGTHQRLTCQIAGLPIWLIRNISTWTVWLSKLFHSVPVTSPALRALYSAKRTRRMPAALSVLALSEISSHRLIACPRLAKTSYSSYHAHHTRPGDQDVGSSCHGR